MGGFSMALTLSAESIILNYAEMSVNIKFNILINEYK